MPAMPVDVPAPEPHVEAMEAALADAERRLAELSMELQATREALGRERGLREASEGEHGGLRGDLTEARRQGAA